MSASLVPTDASAAGKSPSVSDKNAASPAEVHAGGPARAVVHLPDGATASIAVMDTVGNFNNMLLHTRSAVGKLSNTIYDARGLAMPLYATAYVAFEACLNAIKAERPEVPTGARERPPADGSNLKLRWKDTCMGTDGESRRCSAQGPRPGAGIPFLDIVHPARGLLSHLRNSIAHNRGQALQADDAKAKEKAKKYRALFSGVFLKLHDAVMTPSDRPVVLSPGVVECLIELMRYLLSCLVSSLYGSSARIDPFDATALDRIGESLSMDVHQDDGPTVKFLDGAPFKVKMQDICCQHLLSAATKGKMAKNEQLNVCWSFSRFESGLEEGRRYPESLADNGFDLVCEHNCRSTGGHPHLVGMWICSEDFYFLTISEIHATLKKHKQQEVAMRHLSLSPIANEVFRSSALITLKALCGDRWAVRSALKAKLPTCPSAPWVLVPKHMFAFSPIRLPRERHHLASSDERRKAFADKAKSLVIDGDDLMVPYTVQSHAIAEALRRGLLGTGDRSTDIVDNYAFGLIATYAAFERQSHLIAQRFEELCGSKDKATAASKVGTASVGRAGGGDGGDGVALFASARSRPIFWQTFKYGDWRKNGTPAAVCEYTTKQLGGGSPRGWDFYRLVVESEEWWQRIFFRFELYYTLRQVMAHKAADVRRDLILLDASEGSDERRSLMFGAFCTPPSPSTPPRQVPDDLFTKSDRMDAALYEQLREWNDRRLAPETSPTSSSSDLQPIRLTSDDIKEISKGLLEILRTICICYQLACEKERSKRQPDDKQPDEKQQYMFSPCYTWRHTLILFGLSSDRKSIEMQSVRNDVIPPPLISGIASLYLTPDNSRRSDASAPQSLLPSSICEFFGHRACRIDIVKTSPNGCDIAFVLFPSHVDAAKALKSHWKDCVIDGVPMQLKWSERKDAAALASCPCSIASLYLTPNNSRRSDASAPQSLL